MGLLTESFRTVTRSMALFAIILFVPITACAGLTDLTLEWDTITDTVVVQVEIYQRDYPSGTYDYTNPVKIVFVPDKEGTILNIPNGTYAWVAKAVDEDGLVSVNSNEVTDTFAVPPKTIQNLKKKLAIPSP